VSQAGPLSCLFFNEAGPDRTACRAGQRCTADGHRLVPVVL